MRTPEPTAVNHKVGDVLTIRNDFFGHGFKINQKVRIIGKTPTDYYAESIVGKIKWWVADQNFMTKKELY